MAAHYVATISNALRAFDKKYDSKNYRKHAHDSFYKDLAWLGLSRTSSFKGKSSKEKRRLRAFWRKRRVMNRKLRCHDF